MLKINLKKISPRILIFFALFFLLNISLIHYAKAGVIEDLLGWAGRASGVAIDITASPFLLVLSAMAVVIGWIIGQLSTIFTYLLFVVARYNDFINEPLVTQGWILVRDLCNMFFILIILVIAFATILRIESYNAKKLLPKLLIMVII